MHALEREQHRRSARSAFSTAFFFARRHSAAQISSRVYMLLLRVLQLIFRPRRLFQHASVLQLLSVAQPCSRSLTAIAAHPLCRAVSSLQGGRASARVLPKEVATRERPAVVWLRVKPALNPDEKHRRGLQNYYRVLQTAAVSSTEEVARDDAMHVMPPVLATGDRQPPEAATEGWALRAPTIRTRT